jgi:SAM-dependent methyltransferase
VSGGASGPRGAGPAQQLAPAFIARDRLGFAEASSRARLSERSQACTDSVRAELRDVVRLRRFCLCCQRTTRMLVDYEYASRDPGGNLAPNWRERLVCDGCGMNNRQRLVAHLVQQFALRSAHPSIYLMEQVTPIFAWVKKNLAGGEVHGSEYLGHQYRGGERIDGVRHEDVMDLSYPDASFDLIVSNDVLEHIPDPERALRECCRVLKPGGVVLATFPFWTGRDTSVARARLGAGGIEHLLAPQYHGNPLSADGCLVFHDFGWDLLDRIRSAGFAAPACEVYFSEEFGHVGTGLLVFRLNKPLGVPGT